MMVCVLFLGLNGCTLARAEQASSDGNGSVFYGVWVVVRDMDENSVDPDPEGFQEPGAILLTGEWNRADGYSETAMDSKGNITDLGSFLNAESGNDAVDQATQTFEGTVFAESGNKMLTLIPLYKEDGELYADVADRTAQASNSGEPRGEGIDLSASITHTIGGAGKQTEALSYRIRLKDADPTEEMRAIFLTKDYKVAGTESIDYANVEQNGFFKAPADCDIVLIEERRIKGDGGARIVRTAYSRTSSDDGTPQIHRYFIKENETITLKIVDMEIEF
jgi:hypothetical protein